MDVKKLIRFLKIKVNNELFRKKIFVLILTLILFISFLIILFLYEISTHRSLIKNSLNSDLNKIKVLLHHKFNHTEKVILKMNNEIKKNPTSKRYIYNVMKVYKTDSFINDLCWSLFSWTDKNDVMVVDTKYGVMKKPLNMRTFGEEMIEYMKIHHNNPNKLMLGEQTIGLTSYKWIIPAGVGLSHKGNYLGSMLIGFKIEELGRLLQNKLSSNDSRFILSDINRRIILSVESSDYTFYNKKKAKLLDDRINYLLDKLEEDPESENKYDISFFGKQHVATLVTKSDRYPLYFIMQYEKKSIRKNLYESFFNKIKISFLILLMASAIILTLRYGSYKD